MPLFGNKFSPKKTRSRKSTTTINNSEHLDELFDENRSVKLNLGEQENVFENGNWMGVNGCHGSNPTASKSLQKLRNKLQDAEEENNLLKLKVEILLDMLTQTTAENHLQQREIDRLRKNDL